MAMVRLSVLVRVHWRNRVNTKYTDSYPRDLFGQLIGSEWEESQWSFVQSKAEEFKRLSVLEDLVAVKMQGWKTQ